MLTMSRYTTPPDDDDDDGEKLTNSQINIKYIDYVLSFTRESTRSQ